MTLRYEQTLDAVDWDALASVFARASLGEPHPQDLQRAYANSAFSIFTYDNQVLIGAARAISDGVYHAQLCDTVVVPEWQGQGIGRHMVEQLLGELAGQKVVLTSSFGKEAFYRKLGFRRHKTALARNYGPWWYEDDQEA